MSYELGIDLGTTYTAAAVARGQDAEVVTLGTRSAAVASVVYVGEDGGMLFGEAAERRAATDPGRVVREFKRRIGDDTPVMIDGRPYPAHELAARMVRWVVDQVTEQQGGPPRRIAVTRPASWGGHKRELYRDALAAQGLRVTRLAEPQAAAVGYAAAERVEPGATIAIYDFGGGTFDATVVRKDSSQEGFELLGQPEGIENLGGIDFDEAVFAHVTGALGSAVEDLDPADPDVLTAVARLRRDCVEAKEALSADTEATIPVLLPGVQTQVRLTRAEFEEMIRPALERTIEALSRAIVSAGLTPGELQAVLLVGGSSRIPLVTRMVSADLGIPVAVDADPRTAIAMGAALVVSDQPKQAEPAPGGVPGGPAAAAGFAGGVAGGALGGETIYGSPPPAQGPGQPQQPPAWQPAASTGDIPRTGDFPRTGGPRTGDIPRTGDFARTGGPRTGDFAQTGGYAQAGGYAQTEDRSRSGPRTAPGMQPVAPSWRNQKGKSSRGISPVSIAAGGALAVVALVGALMIFPSLASGSGDGNTTTTLPPTTLLPGVGNTGGGGGNTGGNTGGGGGNTGGGNTGGGGNQGGQGNTGGGVVAPTTTAPSQTGATTTTTLPETTTSTTTSTTLPETTTTTTTSTTLPVTTTSTTLDESTPTTTPEESNPIVGRVEPPGPLEPVGDESS